MAACPAALKSAGGRGLDRRTAPRHRRRRPARRRAGAVRPAARGRFGEPARPRHDGPRVPVRAHGGRARPPSTPSTAGRLLGLFAPVHLTRKYAPLEARRGGASTDDGRCVEQDRGTQPTLRADDATAIDLLDNPDGFFLQVEGAGVDKAEHERDVCGAIGELEDLDLAVQVALDYQATHPETLVIVTGDHAHSTQIVMDDKGGIDTATVTTADGDPMTVAYSTTYREAGDSKATHTGTQIRVAAIGPGSQRVTGVIDQTELHAIMLGRSDVRRTRLPRSRPAGLR